jgi:hypothetical protein
VNLVQLAEEDLLDTLEGDWSTPIILIDPDGVTYDKSANDPTLDLVGQVIRDTIVEDPNIGSQLVVHNPMITVRISSLTRVPSQLEKWVVKIPNSPLEGAPLKSYKISRPSMDGSTLGIMKLYLQELEQSV